MNRLSCPCGRLVIFLLVVVGIVAAAGRIRADERFDKAIGTLVGKVSKEFDERKFNRQLIVGSFVPPPRLQSVGGVALQRRIVLELEENGFAITKADAKQLLGSFKIGPEKAHQNDNFESAAIKVEAKLLDEKDRDLKDFSIGTTYVFGDAVLPFSGATVSLSAELRESERQEVLTRTIANPPKQFPGVIQEFAVRADVNSPFSIEVHVLKEGVSATPGQELDERDFVPLAPVIEGGQATLQIPRNRLYIVKLTNDADFEAAAGVFIDTLSMFAFSDDGRVDGKVVVKPRQSAFIKGWYRTEDNSNAFSVGTYSESAAAKQLVNESETGAITATFAACWIDAAPEDEKLIGNPKGDGTKIDIPIRQKYEVVKRQIGKIRSAVTVHYNR